MIVIFLPKSTVRTRRKGKYLKHKPKKSNGRVEDWDGLWSRLDNAVFCGSYENEKMERNLVPYYGRTTGSGVENDSHHSTRESLAIFPGSPDEKRGTCGGSISVLVNTFCFIYAQKFGGKSISRVFHGRNESRVYLYYVPDNVFLYIYLRYIRLLLRSSYSSRDPVIVVRAPTRLDLFSRHYDFHSRVLDISRIEMFIVLIV